MPKEIPKKKSSKPNKLVLVFIIGLILGIALQFFLFQPLMDNSDSFKSKLADCQTSRGISDKEISRCVSCLESNGIDKDDCT